MSELLELQKTFMDGILHPGNKNKDLSDLLSPAPSDRSQAGMNVYRNAYFLRLLGCMNKEYSALAAFMGDLQFESLIKQYLYTFPPTHYSIRQVGKNFIEFLQSQSKPLVWRELAIFEKAMSDALVARDREVLTMQGLSALPQSQWVDTVFQLHPSATIIDCKNDVVTLWEALHDNAGDAAEITVDESRTFVVVWRKRNESFYRPLTEHEAILLTAMKMRHTFGNFCELMTNYLSENDVVLWVAKQLQYWIAEGLLCLDE